MSLTEDAIDALRRAQTGPEDCVGGCGNAATYRRACGHYYCEVCTDLCDPITHRFSPSQNRWVECREDEGDIHHVNITVSGDNHEEVEAVNTAIEQMMSERYETIKVERVRH